MLFHFTAYVLTAFKTALLINMKDRARRILFQGGVSELADEHDLGSCAERLGGSSPPFPTTMNSIRRRLLLPGFLLLKAFKLA